MKYFVSLLLIILSTGLFSQAIITDRPDQTESPVAVSPGLIQVESGLLFQRMGGEDGISMSRSVYPTNLFRIGLVKNLELRVVNEISTYKIQETAFNDSIEINRSYSGTEDMQIGFKYQFTPLESKVIVGLMGHVFVPTGSAGISADDYGVLGRLNVAFSIDEKRGISANFGYVNNDLDLRDNREEQLNGNFTYTLAYGHSLSDRVGLYIEAYGDYVEFEEWENNMDAGITYLLRDHIQLDYSYGWGLENIMNYHSIGISFYIPSNSQM